MPAKDQFEIGLENPSMKWGSLMANHPPGHLTQMLDAAGRGDPRAAAELLPMLYSELRKLARDRLAKTPPGNTLQPTALVHEAYLR